MTARPVPAGGFGYLSSPYTHDEEDVRFQRFIAACRKTAELMEGGEVIFSPIVHGHTVEKWFAGGRQERPFWKRQCLATLRHASKVYVLMLPGWEDSEGIQYEVEAARSLHIPIEYLTA